MLTNIIINGTEMPILQMEDKIAVLPDITQVVFYNSENPKELDVLSEIGVKEANYALFTPKLPEKEGDTGIGVVACITDTDGIETDADGITQIKITIEGITRAKYTLIDLKKQRVTVDQVISRPKGEQSGEDKELNEQIEKLVRQRCLITGESYYGSIYEMIMTGNGGPEEIIYEDLRSFTSESYDLDAAMVLASELMVRDNTDQMKLMIDYLQKEIAETSKEMGVSEEVMNSDMPEEELTKILAIINRIPSLEPQKEDVIKTITRIYKAVPDFCFRSFTRQMEVASSPEAHSSEGHSALQYIETVLAFPWGTYSDNDVPPQEAIDILTNSHYGMDDVKDKVLEYIASLKYVTTPAKAQILCMVGPPGVGKTSIAKNIAKAVGREFVKVSLAGVGDNHAIKGHRKTYVASMPGMIVTALKRAKTCNPVILLDEIDKLGDGGRSKPSDALLEVLDPEQNHEFEDHYMNMPTDISRVLFICTANYMQKIPAALRDRLSLLELPGYTSKERFQIANKFLIPSSLEEYGLKGKVKFRASAINSLTMDYTREAGVRNLGRAIDDVCKKILKKAVFEGMEINNINVDKKMVDNMMATSHKFDHHKMVNKNGVVGRVNGLAWTSVGGCTLPLEVVLTPSKTAKMAVTGNLGNVMKESMNTAMTVVTKALTGTKFLKRIETSKIHLHAPEGAIPKDGPSAGITAVTALMSAITEIPVSTELAMTGEVSLLGEVMPIGGLTEKLSAAVEVGCDTIIIPARNKRDHEMAVAKNDDILKLKIHPVKHVDQVLKIVFGNDWQKKVKEQEIKMFPETKKDAA